MPRRVVLNTFAQRVNHAAFANLAGQAGQKLHAVDVVGIVLVEHGQLFEGGKPSVPVMWRTIRVSSPFSEVSVAMVLFPPPFC